MTDQQMPARIWRDLFVSENDDIHCKSVEFIRSDIAARMAEAILASIDMIDGCHDAPKNPDSLPQMVKVHLQQALSAFRSATQDTEARHD